MDPVKNSQPWSWDRKRGRCCCHTSTRVQQRTCARIPSGMIYKILEWNPEKKPTHLWKGTSDEVQIRKTYCLTVKAVRSFLQWQNHVFSDAISGKAKTAVTITSSLVPIPEADRGMAAWPFSAKEMGSRISNNIQCFDEQTWRVVCAWHRNSRFQLCIQQKDCKVWEAAR